MKRSTLKKLAAIGLMSGLAVACQNESGNAGQGGANDKNSPSNSNQNTQQKQQQGTNGKNTNSSMSQKQAAKIIPVVDTVMSEEELLKTLNDKGKALYYTLDNEGKQLARELASQSCAGHNKCKGLNSCKSANNECAGLGSCKGTSACGFSDKNTAVKVAVKHMAEKRTKTSY